MINVINGKDFLSQFEGIKDKIILIFCLLPEQSSFTYLDELFKKYPAVSAKIERVVSTEEKEQVNPAKTGFRALVYPVFGYEAFRFFPVFRYLNELGFTGYKSKTNYFILPDGANETVSDDILRAKEETLDDKEDFFVVLGKK